MYVRVHIYGTVWHCSTTMNQKKVKVFGSCIFVPGPSSLLSMNSFLLCYIYIYERRTERSYIYVQFDYMPLKHQPQGLLEILQFYQYNGCARTRLVFFIFFYKLMRKKRRIRLIHLNCTVVTVV